MYTGLIRGGKMNIPDQMRSRVLARFLSPLFVSFFGAVLAIVLFARLADEMLEGETRHFDEVVSGTIHGFVSPALTEIMIVLTYIGNATGVIIAAVIACVVLWLRHRLHRAVLLAVTVSGSALLMWTLKQLFHRKRPLPCGFPKPVGYSFPSGHALVSFCFFMVLAAMITAEQKTSVGRVAVWVIAALMVFGIGLSRIYLCAHYPSDVVAGYLAALVWVLGVTIVYRRLRQPASGRLHE